MKESPSLLSWRKKQRLGSIMKSSTFAKIKANASAHGATNPEAVAGAAYWRAAEAKYREKRPELGGLRKHAGR